MISVKDNVAEVLGWAGRLSSQYEFAVAKALTDTMRDVRDAMPAELGKALDKPTEYTKRGFYFSRAEKARLVAVVGVKDQQAKYLHYQVEGGTRPPARKALRLPSDLRLDEHGNVPAGLIRQLVARAKANKRATKTQASRFKVSRELDLFYGEPGDGRLAGIYKRVVLSGGREQLVPIIVFPKQSARYEERFDFHGVARRIVGLRFDQRLRQAWSMARASAR